MKVKIIQIWVILFSVCFAQNKSSVFPILSLASHYSNVPTFGLSHYLDNDYTTGGIFTALEGTAYFFSQQCLNLIRDNTNYPNASTDLIKYNNNARGISAYDYSKYFIASQLKYVPIMLSDIDHFLAFRKYWNNEMHSEYVSQSNILDLVSSPFQTRYLKNPEIFIPILIASSVPFWEKSEEKSLFNTKTINIFGKDYSTTSGSALKILNDLLFLSLVAVSEEVLFRGMLQNSLSEAVSLNFGLVVSSVLFGLAHLPNHNLIYSLRAMAAGFYLGWQYQKYGNDLGRTITLHFHIDFMPTLIGLIKSPSQSNGVYSVGY